MIPTKGDNFVLACSPEGWHLDPEEVGFVMAGILVGLLNRLDEDKDA